MPADMSAEGFEVLRAAVTVARDRQIHSVRVLRNVLKGLGYAEEAIAEAIVTWGRYAVDRGASGS